MLHNIYSIGTRPYETDLLPPNEYHLSQDHNTLFALSYLGVIQVIGERAQEFLQGQFTCDIRDVTANTMRQGAQCNLKGRVLAIMDIINCWDNFWLVLPKDLIAQTCAALEKTAQLSRVKLMPVENIGVYGLHQALPTPPLPNETNSTISNAAYCYYRLDKTYGMILNRNDDITAIKNNLSIQDEMRDELYWHQLQLSQQRFSIYPETRGIFLPHQLDLQHTNMISFQKGCYKGQEIVARMQYLGKLKQELKIINLVLKEPPVLGKELFHPEIEQVIGEVVDYCPLDADGQYLIACVVAK